MITLINNIKFLQKLKELIIIGVMFFGFDDAISARPYLGRKVCQTICPVVEHLPRNSGEAVHKMDSQVSTGT